MNSDNLAYISLLIMGIVTGLQGLLSFLESGANIRIALWGVGSILILVSSGYVLMRGSDTEQIPSLYAWGIFFGVVLYLSGVLLRVL